MPAKGYFFERIEQEFSMARNALEAGNAGKARVCARRAAGQALTWLCTKYPRPGWSSDALSQLLHLKDDPAFPEAVRDAALRLTTKVSEKIDYPFSTDPI